MESSHNTGLTGRRLSIAKSDSVTAEDVSVALFGSGDCTLNCKGVGTVSVKISGSGDCTLTGTAATLANIDISGSGDFNMRGLSVGQ